MADNGSSSAGNNQDSDTTTIFGNYTLQHMVGKGAYGSVYEATDNETGTLRCAVKIFQKRDVQEFVAETMFLTHLNQTKSAYVPQMYGASMESKTHCCYIAMEYFDDCLASYIHPGTRPIDPRLNAQEKLQVICDLVFACDEILQGRVCHLDIKPENILMDKETKRISVCDFSNSCWYAPPFHSNKVVLPSRDWTTVLYRPPETSTYTTFKAPDKCDVWSLAIIIVQMILEPAELKELIREFIKITQVKDEMYWNVSCVVAEKFIRKWWRSYVHRHENDLSKILGHASGSAQHLNRASAVGAKRMILYFVYHMIPRMMAIEPRDRISMHDVASFLREKLGFRSQTKDFLPAGCMTPHMCSTLTRFRSPTVSPSNCSPSQSIIHLASLAKPIHESRKAVIRNFLRATVHLNMYISESESPMYVPIGAVLSAIYVARPLLEPIWKVQDPPPSPPPSFLQTTKNTTLSSSSARAIPVWAAPGSSTCTSPAEIDPVADAKHLQNTYGMLSTALSFTSLMYGMSFNRHDFHNFIDLDRSTYRANARQLFDSFGPSAWLTHSLVSWLNKWTVCDIIRLIHSDDYVVITSVTAREDVGTGQNETALDLSAPVHQWAKSGGPSSKK